MGLLDCGLGKNPAERVCGIGDGPDVRHQHPHEGAEVLRLMARVAVWATLQRAAKLGVAVRQRPFQVLNRQHAVGRDSHKAIEELVVLAQDGSLVTCCICVVVSMKLQGIFKTTCQFYVVWLVPAAPSST